MTHDDAAILAAELREIRDRLGRTPPAAGGTTLVESIRYLRDVLADDVDDPSRTVAGRIEATGDRLGELTETVGIGFGELARIGTAAVLVELARARIDVRNRLRKTPSDEELAELAGAYLNRAEEIVYQPDELAAREPVGVAILELRDRVGRLEDLETRVGCLEDDRDRTLAGAEPGDDLESRIDALEETVGRLETGEPYRPGS